MCFLHDSYTSPGQGPTLTRWNTFSVAVLKERQVRQHHLHPTWGVTDVAHELMLPMNKDFNQAAKQG